MPGMYRWIKQEFKVTMFVADNEKIRGLPDKKGQANFNDLVMTVFSESWWN